MTVRFALLLVVSLAAFRPSCATAAHPLFLSKQACTFVSSVSYYISAPGHYCMDMDISTDPSQQGGIGVLIDSSDVLMDCMGHEIAGDAGTRSDTGIRATSGLHNVTIQNCKLTHFDNGINVDGFGNQDIRLLNNHVKNSTQVGIRAGGNQLRVIGNHVTNTSVYPNHLGIELLPYQSGVPASGQVLLNNLVAGIGSDQGSIGISIDGSTAPQIINNQVTLTSATGTQAWLWLRDDGQGAATSGAKVLNNAATSNGGGGILGVAAVCIGNTTMGFSINAFDSCVTSQDNTIIL